MKTGIFLFSNRIIPAYAGYILQQTAILQHSCNQTTYYVSTSIITRNTKIEHSKKCKNTTFYKIMLFVFFPSKTHFFSMFQKQYLLNTPQFLHQLFHYHNLFVLQYSCQYCDSTHIHEPYGKMYFC